MFLAENSNCSYCVTYDFRRLSLERSVVWSQRLIIHSHLKRDQFIALQQGQPLHNGHETSTGALYHSLKCIPLQTIMAARSLDQRKLFF